MTEEQLNEIKRHFHQQIIDESLKSIKHFEELKDYCKTSGLPHTFVCHDLDIKIAKLDEKVRKSMLVLERIK